MRVLLVSPLPPPAGGIATWTQKYIKYFEENGLSCAVVNTAVIGARKAEINHKKNYLDEVRRAFSICSKTKNEIKKYAPNIAHINSSCTKMGVFRDYAVISLLKRNLIPVVLHCHCNIEDQLNGRIPRFLFSRMVKSSNVVLVLNDQSRQYIESIALGKAIMLPNFIEPDRLSADRVINEAITTILFVGHIWRPKGVLEIFEAARQMPNITFSLVGPVRDDMKEVNTPSNVRLMGEQDTEVVKKCLSEADVFLFPSYTEGFSNALAEAMAAGLPVIATPVGANVDMLEGKGGLIVPAGDASSIVSALKRMTEKRIRQEMSEWNVQKVKDHYLIDRVMNRLLSIYSEVLNERIQVSDYGGRMYS